ncbi:MAG: oligosaccharide flippase family protein [Firmicutes bacterium]|jgi:stage V sporulation protein B|nr:oligosaccharide flippase family protein [Bacillota bacterium]
MTAGKGALASVTAVLTLSSVLSRLWGFALRAALARLLGAEGVGLNQVVGAYFLGFVIPIAAGLSPAVSRMIAPHSDGRRNPRSDAVVSTAVLVALAASTAAAVAARFVRPASIEARVALAPGAVGLMVTSSALYAVLEAFFIGSGNPRVLLVAEQLQEAVRFGLVVIVLANAAELSLGLRLRWLVVLTAFSEVIGLAWLASKYASVEFTYPRPSPRPSNRHPIGSPVPAIASELLQTAWPVSATRLAGSLMRMAEVSLAPAALVKSGMTAGRALAVYGEVVGMAAPVVMIPGILTSSLAVSLVPEVARCGSSRAVRKKAWTVSIPALLFGVAVARFIGAFSRPISRVLYGSACDPSVIAETAVLAPAVYLDQVTSAVLRGAGLANAALVSDLLAWMLRLALVSTLPGRPGQAARGIAAALIASSAFSAMLNVAALALLPARPGRGASRPTG